MARGHDVTYYKTWYRSSRGEVQVCSERRPIRNLTFQDLHLHHSAHQANASQDLAQRHGLESVSDHHGNFSITIYNLTLADSGLYCCLVVEVRHRHSEHRVHGAMELVVQTGEGSSMGLPGPVVGGGGCDHWDGALGPGWKVSRGDNVTPGLGC